MSRLTIFAVALAVALCAPALADDLINGADSASGVTAGFYASDEDGNMDWVREYDGRDFGEFVGLERFYSLGYSGPLQYGLYARDLIVGDEDAFFGFSYMNDLGLKLGTFSLTHRLPRIPAINPYLAGTAAAGGDDFLDLSPTGKFLIDRRVNVFGLGATPGDRRFRLAADFWQEIENGTQQLLFRAREAQEGVIANRQRAAVALPVDRNTDESSFGGDLEIGGHSVLNYRFVNTDFEDKRSSPAPGSSLDFLPLNSLTRVSSNTRSNVIKARSRLGDRLYFTGVHISKERTNEAASLVSQARADINSTNLALTYLATNSFTLTGRCRRLDMDNEVAPEVGNMGLSKDVKSAEIAASYTGIPRTFVQMGFERRDTDRSLTSGEFVLPFTSESTESNIWRVRARYYPSLRFSVSGSFEDRSADNSGYSGVANDVQQANLNTTYLITDSFALYGDYSMWNAKNDQIRVAFGDIPALLTDAEALALTPEERDAYAELREEAAGQGYKNDNTVATLGAWYAVNSRLVLDANYSKIDTDSSNLWILGVSPGHTSGGSFVPDTPHLIPNVVAFDAQNTQWSAGATYVLAPKWRVYGRFLESSADGASILNTSAYPDGMPSVWTPVDVKEKRYTIGFGHDVSLTDSLQLDFSISDWVDKIDPANDGTFSLWRLAWAHKF